MQTWWIYTAGETAYFDRVGLSQGVQRWPCQQWVARVELVTVVMGVCVLADDRRSAVPDSLRFRSVDLSPLGHVHSLRPVQGWRSSPASAFDPSMESMNPILIFSSQSKAGSRPLTLTAIFKAVREVRYQHVCNHMHRGKPFYHFVMQVEPL